MGSFLCGRQKRTPPRRGNTTLRLAESQHTHELRVVKTRLVKQAIAALEREAFPEEKAYIDRALGDIPTHQVRGSAWYYRGVIDERLLRGRIATGEEAAQLFEETLTCLLQSSCLDTSGHHSTIQLGYGYEQQGTWWPSNSIKKEPS